MPLGTDDKKVIDLFSVPRPYRPETVQQRMEREIRRIEEENEARIQRLKNARKKVSDKNEKE